MKVGILALVLLVDVSCIQIDSAEFLEHIPEVAGGELQVTFVMLFSFVTAALTSVAPSF